MTANVLHFPVANSPQRGEMQHPDATDAATRRWAPLRVILHPRAAARTLELLAEEAHMSRCAVGAVLRACAATHVPRR
jgi:hypothetical protein